MSAQLRAKALERGDRASSMVVYRFCRGFLRLLVNRWVRTRSFNAEVLDLDGPLILAPIHRSHLDSALVATCCERRVRALGKESLFTTPGVSYLCAALGAIPVKRGAADRDALVAARELLARGESMIVFPEGGRGTGNKIEELFDGAAWLSARTGAPVVPIGIAGTEEALPVGARFLRRSNVVIVVDEPLAAPVDPEGRRVGRQRIKEFSEEIGQRLQAAQDEAVAHSQSDGKRSKL